MKKREETKVASGCDNITIERMRYRAKRKVLRSLKKTANSYYMRYDTNYANKKKKRKRVSL